MSDTENHSLESSETEDILDVAARGWDRIISAAGKTGYREGIEDGSESVFQEAFDQGYADAFQTAFTLGKYKGLLNAISDNTPDRQDINEILDKTRRGACYICEVEKESKSPIDEAESFPDIATEQKKHSKKVIDKLDSYFKSVSDSLTLDTPPDI